MNKKLFVSAILSGTLLSGLVFSSTEKRAFADNAITFDSDTIIALSHCGGETVNFVNSDLAEYWDSDSTNIEKLKSLYEMNNEIASFVDNSFDFDYTRQLFAKWDDFKPVNNTLTWKSNISATSYDVVVSLNPELTEAVYEAKGLLEPEYKMANPFANTHYYWQVTAYTKDRPYKSPIFDFYSGDYKRTVEIPSVSNTRDVGGFTGQYGTMKQGLIFRSARFDDANSSCYDAIHQLDIQTDLDLRAVGEGTANPIGLPKFYQRNIKQYDLKEENRPALVEAVRVFADPSNYPVVFHCAIGRDRTGTLAMILQALAGASKEYIIHDYFTSMWSVVASYSKSISDLNLALVNSTLNQIEACGDDLYTGIVNYLKVREDTITHEQVGLTDEEITLIRDIWSGRTSVEHGQKTFKAENNYEGKAYVLIKAVGHKDTYMMVEKGTKISAPYALDDIYAWFTNGQEFDFNTTINESMVIYADYSGQYRISIHYVGIDKADEVLKRNYGDVISMNRFELDGYDYLAVSDEGREISRLEVTRDTFINIIYFKK